MSAKINERGERLGHTKVEVAPRIGILGYGRTVQATCNGSILFYLYLFSWFLWLFYVETLLPPCANSSLDQNYAYYFTWNFYYPVPCTTSIFGVIKYKYVCQSDVTKNTAELQRKNTNFTVGR